MRNIFRIFCVVFATATVCAQTPMKYDNFSHQVLKPPVSAGSIYDYDFTGLSIHGIGGGGTPGGTTGQFQFNAGGGTFGGMPTINTTGGAAVIIDADNVIFDQSGASTKKFHFNGVNITAGQNRAANVPDATSTFVIPDAGDSVSVLTGITTAGAITKGPVTDAQSALMTKPNAAAASISNVSLSGLPVMDGYSLLNNDIALLTAQTSASESGPWVVHGGAWARPSWYASGNTSQAEPKMQIWVRNGSTYSGSTFYCSSPTSGSITIDTTATGWTNASFAINGSTVFGGAVTGTGKVVLDTSPTISAPTITGHETIEGITATGATGTGKFVFDTSPTISAPTISGHPVIEGVTSTGATGTGKFVFDGTPTINTPVIAGGLTASGAGSNNFTGSTGAFQTSFGTNTLNGIVVISPLARVSGTNPYFNLNIPSDTGQTAGQESIGYLHSSNTRQWASTGTVVVQRENVIQGPTYSSASASQTFTDAVTLAVTAPIAGTNAIFTRGHSLAVVDSTSASSSITGGLVVATTLGTTATSVGIGGGNINAGGTLTVGGHDTLEGVTSTGATGTGKHVYDGTPTIISPVISTGLTASGSAANDFSASTGTFKTSTGANTLGGNTTINGTETITPAARSSGVASYFTLNIPADTAQTAATESIGYQHVTATRTWATTGTVGLQRENYFAGPTYASASASQTFTDAATVYIDKPLVGANAVFTRAHSLAIVDNTTSTTGTTGALVVATTLGTSGTAVGIGAGNVTAGNVVKGNSLTSVLGMNGTTATGIFDFNQAKQSQLVVSATEYYLTNSNLNMPATYVTAIGAGTTMKWRFSMTKDANGTGTFQILFKKGTNGTTADATLATITVGTQTAAADNMECDATLTWTSTTAAYWSVIPHQSAASGVGFGLVYPAVAAQFTGTISGQTTTTASDKYGLSVVFTTGTPTFTVPMMQAQAFGVD